MATLLFNLATTAPSKVMKDDDFIDRLHNRYTVTLLVVFAVVVAGQTYMGNAISCWVPAEFTGAHTKYTNSFCWVRNTYFLPFENEIPKDWEPEKRTEIMYYQWAPFIFLAMAILYYAPSVVWHALNSKSGVDADNILVTANNFSKCSKMDTRERQLTMITNQMDRFLGSVRPKTEFAFSCDNILSSSLFRCCGKRFGNYLIILYTFVKFLYIGNTFFQLFMLNSVLKTDYNIFGIELIQTAIHGTPIEEMAYLNNSIFPKVTMCDFHARKLGNVHRYTVQCLLPINMYTEMIFTMLWFWMVFVLFISVLGLLILIIRSAWATDRFRYIENHLMTAQRVDKHRDRDLIRNFQADYLKQDGVFLLRMIGSNTNGITVNEIIGSMWDFWMDNRYPGQAKKLNDDMDDGSLEDEKEPNDLTPLTSRLKPPVPPKPGSGVGYPRLSPNAPSPEPPGYSDDTLPYKMGLDEPDGH